LTDEFDERGSKMPDERRGPVPERPIVPLEYAGLWIAWDRDHIRIVASGQTIEAAFEAAIAAGEPEPILGRAPRADEIATGIIQFDAFPIHD
jgi:hypothetical protein